MSNTLVQFLKSLVNLKIYTLKKNMSVIIVDRLVITWYLLIIVTFSFKGFLRIKKRIRIRFSSGLGQSI